MTTVALPERRAADTGGGEDRGAGRGADEPLSMTLAVGGMTCGACAARIERRLNRLPGVDARVNYATARATVALQAAPGTAGAGRVLHEIEDAGYSADVVESVSQLADPAAEEAADRKVRSLGRRLVVSAVLFMPLCDASLAFSLFPVARFPHWQLVVVALALPVVTWAAWPFYTAALAKARHGTSSMDTLVSLGILAATGWSLYAMFRLDQDHARQSVLSVLGHGSGGAIYLDVAAGVTTFVLAGRYYEALCQRRSGRALRALAAVGAKEATLVDPDGRERRVPAAALAVGDRFSVRPGETVAADGRVTTGHTSLDRSAMTGESVPVEVGPGDVVVGGTVSAGGRVVVEATRVGRDTQLAHMVRLVEDAQNQKAAVQRLADRASAVFVPAVLVASALTLTGWLAAGAGAERAFSAALAVLIIACPCALGLATPTALVVAAGQGARLGIFFKRYQALEASRQIDTVVLDKTGTVTHGAMALTGLSPEAGTDPDELLRCAGAVERASEHPVARAVAAHAEAALGALPPVEGFTSEPGLGARGRVEGREVVVGSAATLPAGAAPAPALVRHAATWERDGRTVVWVQRDGAVLGAVAVADTVRPTARAAVAALHGLGLHTLMVSGDNEPTARAIGAAIGVDDVVAGALPADKVAVVRRLQAQGHAVAVVGDGVNDGPALAGADLGIAVGSGTDVAIGAADLIVARDDLRVIATAIELSRRTLRTIHGNLLWAFAYNVAAIPLAALGLLNPLIAAATMALSSAFVVFNSSRLRHVRAVATGEEEDALAARAPRGAIAVAAAGR